MFFTRLSMSPVWRSINEMQHEMNRLFDRWGRHPLGLGEYPAVNLWEDDDAFFLETELPGLELQDLELFVTGQTQFTIKGERKPPAIDKGIAHRQERGFGKFTRTLTLPFPVDENAVEARLENGVLKVRLPKHEAAKPRKIQVKA